MDTPFMDENCADFLPLRATNVGVEGKRTFDKHDKQRLIEACLNPGVSIAGMALKAGVNANQLRRWIKNYEARLKGAAAPCDSKALPSAFVPVVAISDDSWAASPMPPQPEPDAPAAPMRVHAPQRPPLPSRLVAQLPNGVSLELECTGQDCALLKTMIDALRGS
jgi:transposase